MHLMRATWRLDDVAVVGSLERHDLLLLSLR